MVRAVASLCLLLCLSAPSLARACSQALRYVDGPEQGAQIPGNQLMFRVYETDGVELSLHERDGAEPVAAHTVEAGGDRLFVADAPVEPGKALVLEVRRGAEVLERYELETTEHAALDFGIAALEVIDDQGDRVVVQYTPPSVNPGTERLLDVEFRVDGQLFGREQLGDDPNTFVLRANCDGFATKVCGVRIDGVDAGHHVLTARPHLLGNDSQPAAASVEFDVGCPYGCSAGVRATRPLRDSTWPWLVLGGLLFAGRRRRA